MEHIDYPHNPGMLYDCPACETECSCDSDYECIACIRQAEQEEC